MADLLSRVRGKPFYLLILIILFTSSCNDSDDDSIELPEPAANNAPTITSSDTDTATLGSPYAYTLIASDADGDALTFQASILPTWLTFDATSGELSGITPTNASGDYQVTLAASDGIDSTPLFLTISIINSAPTITSTANNNGVVGDAYSYTLTANDVDADTLTFSSITLPSWAMLNDTSGEMTGTPDASGDYEVELSVSDGELSANQRFTLVVTNEPSVVIGFDQAVVFSDFGGAVADIIANPDQSGINTSDQVGRMQKFAGEVFGGSTISLDDPITLAAKLFFGQAMTSASLNGKSFAADNIFTLKVWSQRQVALTFKIEGDVDENDVERVVTHDGTGWEVLSFDFTGVTGTGYTAITLIFDNGVVGDAADDSANWTFYFDDMVIPVATNNDDDDTDGGNTVGPEILINGGFEAGFANWKDDVGTIEVDGSNSFFFADVQAAGNPWDVNQSQVITLMPDTDYILSFKAKASVARTIIAGLGQNFPDFIAVTETVALTTEWQTYTYTLTTTGFGGENNRVLFDMGSEIGAVSLDDVSVTLASVDNGGDTGGDADGTELTTNGDLEVGDLSGWTSAVNGGNISADNTQDSGSTWSAHIVAGPGNNPAFSQAGLAVGTVNPGDTIDISFDMCGTAASGGVIFPALLSEFGGDAGADRQTLETIATPPSIWTRYNYSAAAGSNVNGGISLQLDVVCGADAACSADVYFDNVSVTINGGPAAGNASGNSCVATDTGDDTNGDANGEFTTNGDFESGFGSWNEVGTIEMEGDNSYLFADVQAAGNPWDVNLSQVMTLMPNTDYILSFRAKASVARTMIAGLGQNFPDFIAVTEIVSLTTEWQTYTYTLTTTGFGGANNRVLFDMGAEIGAVSLDDVSVTLVSVNDGGGTGGGDTGGDTVTPLAVELVVFETAALPEWAAWTDGKGPTEVLQDGEYGGVTKFTLTGPTVAGFTSRDGGGAVNGMTFDASNLTNGMITFDFKMVKAPDAGLVDWKLKIESSTGTNAEVNLSSSVEGHATPLLDTWQTYSFPIATLVAKGLDATAIDLFMVFPDYNNATGAEFYLDNFKITSGGAASSDSDGNTTSSMSGGSLIVDVTAGINFEGNEAEQASWDVFENVTNPALEFVTNPYMLGNTSSQSAKITLETAGAGSGKFAGAVTRTVTTFKLSTDTVIAKIWVYKDKISPVGIKFERKRSDGYGSHGELTVSNTKINEWEQLTIDFTSQLGLPENDEISGIAIFPDMVDGRTGTVVYFDEITFTPN